LKNGKSIPVKRIIPLKENKMNKNSTQTGIRNFVSKIFNSFKSLPALPANLRVAGSFISVRHNNLTQAEPVSSSINFSFSNKNCYNSFMIPALSNITGISNSKLFNSNMFLPNFINTQDNGNWGLSRL
jgi:hypothetical protein